MKCIYTYTDCYIDYKGITRPCCNQDFDYGSLVDDTISNAFTSRIANDVRKHMAINALDKIPPDCRNCINLNRLPDCYTFEGMYPKLAGGTEEYSDNYQKIHDAFSVGGYIPAGAKPLHLLVQFGEMCNFRCIMCPQDHSAHNRIDPKVVQEIKAAIPTCQRLTFTGGEPLVYRELWEIMEYIKDNAQENIHINILTNGSLLTKDGIEKYFSDVNNLTLGINIDAATQETYEKIRVGGKWAILMQNIDDMQEYSKAHNKNWTINMGFVVMKSNLEEMKEAIILCGKLGIGFGCGPITGQSCPVKNCRAYLQENIFRFKHLGSEDYILTHLNEALEATKYLSEGSQIAAAANIRGVIDSFRKTSRVGIPPAEAHRMLTLDDESLANEISIYFLPLLERTRINVERLLIKVGSRVKKRLIKVVRY